MLKRPLFLAINNIGKGLAPTFCLSGCACSVEKEIAFQMYKPLVHHLDQRQTDQCMDPQISGQYVTEKSYYIYSFE